MKLRPFAISLALAVGALAVAASWFAPYLYAEWLFDVNGAVRTPEARPTVPVHGRWFDDYFVIEAIDEQTFAIGEPRYYQGNYSYLIVGTVRAVLFDAGSGVRDIVPVARSLTTLPITVVASHLHFDHVGALGRLDRTAVLDAASLRERIKDSTLTLDRYEFLGFADRLRPPTFKVDEWWSPETEIDIGGRKLLVMATPGHTPTSVSLYDAERHQLFAGDFIYPGNLYAFLPGASRSAYLNTAKRLLATLEPNTKILTAHMADPTEVVQAPMMEIADLEALVRCLMGIERGAVASRGFYPRVFPVREALRFDTGWPWNNR